MINGASLVLHVPCRSASSASQPLQQTFRLKFVLFSWGGAKPLLYYKIYQASKIWYKSNTLITGQSKTTGTSETTLVPEVCRRDEQSWRRSTAVICGHNMSAWAKAWSPSSDIHLSMSAATAADACFWKCAVCSHARHKFRAVCWLCLMCITAFSQYDSIMLLFLSYLLFVEWSSQLIWHAGYIMFGTVARCTTCSTDHCVPGSRHG